MDNNNYYNGDDKCNFLEKFAPAARIDSPLAPPQPSRPRASRRRFDRPKGGCTSCV